jgi:hypothetical protein
MGFLVCDERSGEQWSKLDVSLGNDITLISLFVASPRVPP